MPGLDLQDRICRLIASAQKKSPGGYLAGGVALQETLRGTRISEDIDRFHDSEEEILAAFARDERVLAESGLRIKILVRQPTFVRALVTDESDQVTRVDWARDSAFRFFPLNESPEFGGILSPMDLATNKALAMAGRLEIRDWIDMMLCHDRLQNLGLLAFAACGKDPGFSPEAVVEMGARCTRYTAEELARIRFRSRAPRLDALHRKWHAIIEEARRLLAILPAAEAGRCVLSGDRPFRGTPEECRAALDAGSLTFRSGAAAPVVGVPQPALVYPDPPDIDPSG